MSAAACAKARIDGGRAIAGAVAFIAQVEAVVEAATDAMTATGDDKKYPPLTEEQEAQLVALSEEWCKWGARCFGWADTTFSTASTILTGKTPETYNEGILR